MKFRKISIQFQAQDLILAEEIISDLFFSLGLKGVVCQVPLDEPDEGFGTHTLPQPEKHTIIGYLPDIDSSDIVEEQIRSRALGLSHLNIQTRILVETVDEEDWAHAWKAYFNVTRISEKIVIRPEWKSHDPAPGEAVIHLDPGMAFGTGTHPTTAMCIRQIEAHLEKGQDFLDVGTGSGILMIAAAKLGAGKMTGIDTDETAVGICRENLEKNRIPAQSFELYAATLDQLPGLSGQHTYDLIAANIIAQVIVDIMADIRSHMHGKSRVILSGIIQERKKEVLKALAAHGLIPVQEETIDEWVTLTAAVE